MKKLFASLTVIASCLFSTPTMSVLRLGLDAMPYPPFYEIDSRGEYTGWEVEIGDALCAAMNEHCIWVGVIWDRIIPSLLNDEIDAIVGSMSITEDRMQFMSFSDKYYSTPVALVASKNSVIDMTAQSVQGKVIGVQSGTTHQRFLDAHYKQFVKDIESYQSFSEHNQDLLAGQVDAVIGDSLAFSELLNSPEGLNYEIKATLRDDSIYGLGVGVGLRQENTNLRQRFNDAIRQIREDGTYAKISAKYFNFDIFGE